MSTNQRKKVGAGWLRTSQDGKTKYISVVISGGLNPDINLVMFQNGYKEKDEQPDYVIYLSAPKDPDGAAASADKPKAQAAAFPGDEEQPASGEGPDEDAPF